MPPIFRPRYSLSAACAASSTTGRPSARIGSRWAGCPYRWTGMIAFVLGVTSAATPAGSMFRSVSRTSAKTGVAPVCTITFAVAGQVIEVVITSSPGPTPSATRARCIAAVPEETARACFAPTYSAKRRSSSAAFGPVVNHPDRIASVTAATSSSPTAGGWKPRKVSRLTLDDSFCGIGNDEAYAVGGAASARDRLLAGRACRHHRPDAVGAPLERPENRPRVGVDAHPEDAVDRHGLVQPLDLDERARLGDEELRTAAAGL